MGPRSQDPTGRGLSAVALLVVLIPYGTLALPFDTSLYVQAGGILFSVAGLLAVSWRWSGRSGIANRDWGPWALGLVLFSMATVFGSGVGLWRGNALRDLAGQVVSMGLLPLAGLAGVTAGVSARRRSLAWSLVGATAGICWIHLGHGVLQILRGEPAGSMILANGVTAAGPTLIALPMALALALRDRSRAARVAAWLIIGVMVGYAVGSGIRSLWAALMVAVPLFLVFSDEWRRLLKPRIGAAVLLLLAGLATGLSIVHHWIQRGGEDVAVFPAPDRAVTNRSPQETLRRWKEPTPARLTSSKEIPPKGAYRLKTCLSEASWGTARIQARWLDRDGQSLGALRLKLTASSAEAPPCVARFGKTPDRATATRLELIPISETGEWRIRTVSLTHLGPEPSVYVARKMQFLFRRLGSLTEMLQVDPVLRTDAGPRAKTETIRFRWRETSRLWNLFQHGTLPEKLLGHGLGARYRLDAHGWDNRGHWVYYEDVNYIHNFFAFLLYKLGLLGGGLVLGALAIWLVWGVKRVRDADRSLEGASIAAGTAALIAATLWSLSSPVFLNFRLAPLWGLVLASMCPRPASDELRP